MLQFITHKTDKYDYYQGAMLALKGACKWIQLRMKDESDEEIIRVGLELRRYCDAFGADLIINDRVDLVEAISADGVHLGKGDMSVQEARAILGNGKIIGATANTPQDVEDLIAKGVNYLGIGPYTYTKTKENLSPSLGLDGYKAILDMYAQKGYRTPFVAIGGIKLEDVEPLMELGVSGLAVSNSILSSDEPIEYALKIRRIVEKYKNRNNERFDNWG